MLIGARQVDPVGTGQPRGHLRLETIGARTLGVGGDDLAAGDRTRGVARRDRLVDLIAREVLVIGGEVQGDMVVEEARLGADFIVSQRLGAGEQAAILDIARFEAGADAAIGQRALGDLRIGARQPGQLVPLAVRVVVRNAP